MVDNKNSLIFIKLGGSLITKKNQPMTPRLDTLNRVMQEIYEVSQLLPDQKIILGHGSGSFGHSVGEKYNTRNGVNDEIDWAGFYNVYSAAKKLNNIVLSIGQEKKLSIIPFPLCSSSITQNRKILNWNIKPLLNSLKHHFIPLVYGDVAFDKQLGGTILSTEEIFDFLADKLQPERILLAGIEPGIWKDYPRNTTIIKKIHANARKSARITLKGSGSIDVTGGMESKVDSMLELIQRIPTCNVQIFSGVEPGSIKNTLLGEIIGTILTI
jgi:isopentenyl phosphate kinase